MSTRILITLVFAVAIAFLLRKIFQRDGSQAETRKMRSRFRRKPDQEIWVQVYDTDSLEEVETLQARLEEEELECFIYEQGRKDVHGNLLKGFGIAVPRTSVSHAQKIIARMPT